VESATKKLSGLLRHCATFIGSDRRRITSTDTAVSTKCTKALQSMYCKVEFISQVFWGQQSFSSARRMIDTKFAWIFDRSLVATGHVTILPKPPP
jgi:hypothetical protein